jgi:O-antigen/teichoic acid export membrane protein
MLPVYTRILDPAEYGSLSLVLAIATATAILFSLGLDVSIFRMYFQFESDPPRQQRFIRTVWTTVIVLPLAAAIVIGAALWPVVGDGRLFSGPDLFLALVGSALSVAGATVPLAVLRAEGRLRTYVIVTLVATGASVVLTAAFVIGLRWGVRGWLASIVVANLATLGAAAVAIPFRLPRRPFDIPMLRGTLSFGLPLVPHSLAQWALQLADRLVLAGLVSAGALGVYSLASNLALPVLVLVQSMNFAFMGAYARAGARPTESGGLEGMVELQAGTVALICAGCALLAPPLIDAIAPASYHPAGPLVPWIALGYGFLGLYYIPMNGIALGAGRTRFVSVATLIGAAANIGLLYLLVPSGGILAGAIASAGGYAVLLAAVYVYSRHPDNPVRYPWGALAVIFAAMGGAYAAGTLTTSDAGVESIVIRTLWLCAGAGVCVLTRGSLRQRVATLAFARRSR